MLRIALDFDDTYTADPMLWRSFITLCQVSGHEVSIVTLRDAELDTIAIDQEFHRRNVPIVYCDGRAKKEYTESLGLHFDIWIDDNPWGLFNGTSFNAEQLQEWRDNDTHRKGLKNAADGG